MQPKSSLAPSDNLLRPEIGDRNNANEDMWIEYQDIKLGAWADKNLRKMAEEAGVKGIYDRYYDTLSGYVHGNWMAVRHSVFGECLNPLHRFHRIPLPPREFEQDAVPDLVKIVNLCLERLTSLYPPFKPRFRLSAEKDDETKLNAVEEPRLSNGPEAEG